MKYMTSKQIRETWLNFFKSKGHSIETSASLIPINDPTLLWINAGVSPLKKYFDGSEKPHNPRLTNIQKCIRTNDIENVGKTARHHTFFEMMGNFSIGDYFREDAIKWGYELLTSSKYFGFDIDKLYMTYYPSDLDSKNVWLSLGVKESHLIANENNFWEIGEGPCGPDTEIFFDRGEKYDKRGIEILEQDLENDRYIEIWNIVLSQFNAKENLSRDKYPELPSKNIDTGAGLERFACVLQETETNFETDLFLPIINEVEKLTDMKYSGQMAFKVISDHIKTLVVAISDGAVLSNEGRGYVLRRLLRRALKYGRNIGLNEPFLHNLIDSVIVIMGEVYKDIISKKEIIKNIILKEEEKFLETLVEGEKHLLSSINKGINSIDKELSFKLYDTYGFPIELTIEYAEEHNLEIDKKGFYEELEKQKNRSRDARTQNQGMSNQTEEYINFLDVSKFVGYDKLVSKSKVIKVFEEGIVLDETPFYANMGGQVSDKGTINDVEVIDVIRLPNGQTLHKLNGSFKLNKVVTASVNKEYRNSIEKNHSATHLLHKALKDVLGNHVNQQGSNVDSNTLRFDFNNYENITRDEILKIEKIVKSKIKEAIKVDIKEMPIDDAKKLGAMALFGEKYQDIVRVVNMNYSIELCGGTHVKNTKEIEDFAILSLESIGSGIYRIEAVSGKTTPKIENFMTSYTNELEKLVDKGNKLLDSKEYKVKKVPIIENSYKDIINIRKYIDDIKNDLKELEKNIDKNKEKEVLSNIDKYINDISGKRVVIKTFNVENKVLKQLLDAIYDKIKAEVVFLINIDNEKATYLCKSSVIDANMLVKKAAFISNGSGGGKQNMAQGGTQDLSKIDLVVQEIKKLL